MISVTRLDAGGPHAIGSGEVLAGHKHLHAMLNAGDQAARLQLGVNAWLIISVRERLSGVIDLTPFLATALPSR